MMISRGWRDRRWILGALVCLSIILISPATSANAPAIEAQLSQGQALYDAGQLSEAQQVLRSGLQIARSQSDALSEAVMLGNLALVAGQQGSRAAANQAIEDSLMLLSNLSKKSVPQLDSVFAQTLNIQGRLQLAQGDAAAAFNTWKQTESRYDQARDSSGVIRAKLRQARALQALGFYQRAVEEILYPLYKTVQADGEVSLTRVTLLNRLAASFQVLEGGAISAALALPRAVAIAEESLTMATALGDEDAIATANLTLGNLAFSNVQTALEQNIAIDLEALVQANPHLETAYQSVRNSQASPANRIRGELNQLNFLVTIAEAYQSRRQSAPAQRWFTQALSVWDSIQPKLNDLELFPANRDGIYARINLVQRGLVLANASAASKPTLISLRPILNQALDQAQMTGDRRSLTYVLGTLGSLAQAEGDIGAAVTYTENALQISKQINATDITYRWYEQLGQLAEGLGDMQAAINAYLGAVDTLKQLRTDLTVINPELLFSFQESVEPIHRKLVNLLLQAADPPQAKLQQARDVIESLQVEELNNYLRAACLNAQVVPISEVPQAEKAAIVYPVILDERLAVITSFPKAAEDGGENFVFHEGAIDAVDLKALSDRIITMTNNGDFDVLTESQQLYSFLIPPSLQTKLKVQQTETLVFVLDGFLRNLSMATLYDGTHFLIENYAVAVTPGLQLLNPEPLQNKALSALTFGLTTPVEGFEQFDLLPSIKAEIESIGKEMPVSAFLDGDFTRDLVKSSLSQSSRPIVHLATHGKFNPNIEETFILASDEPIYINELSQWLRSGRNGETPIELLVFSACETGISDDEGRAALGLAGIAVRSGARSTVASLWQADDTATAIIMEEFYKQLAKGTVSKAQALQRAQTFFIQNYVEDDHPYYWGSFILVGNWL